MLYSIDTQLLGRGESFGRVRWSKKSIEKGRNEAVGLAGVEAVDWRRAGVVLETKVEKRCAG